MQYENPRFAVQEEVGQAFCDMRVEAAKSGIAICPISSFRDFASQLKIWNRKFSGERPLYGRNGQAIDASRLSQREVIAHILIWSALPGASRHHWGTDIDVVDRAAISAEYFVQLLPEEFREGGPFYRMHLWLEENMVRFGFYRPYRGKDGGVAAEPWHISYGKIAARALSSLKLETLRQVVEESELTGKEAVLEMLPAIYRKYVINVESFCSAVDFTK